MKTGFSLGDLLKSDGLIVSSAVTDSGGAQVSASLISETSLMPWDPGERILWAIRHGVQVALGDTWSNVQSALPNMNSFEEMKEFAMGVAAGVRDSIEDFVSQNIDMIAQGTRLIIGFYGLVFDIDIWIELAKVYTDDPGTDLSEFSQFLQDNYPALYTSLVSLPKLRDRLSRLTESLTTNGIQASPWPASMFQIANWAVVLSQAIGDQLRPEISDVVAHKGNPGGQGQIIGKVVSNVVIQTVAIASGLFALLQGVLGASRVVLSGIRQALADSRAILTAAQLASNTAPGIIEAGNQAAQGIKEAVTIYANVAYKISPYKNLLKDTGAFNDTVRDVAGFGVYDQQYRSMRLDAHHLVEDVWYSKFSVDFDQVFGWKSANDMDAIALHYEWHIRSGKSLGKFGYIGAEDQKSLTNALKQYLKQAQIGPSGAPKPFTRLSELVQAHANFYSYYSSHLWQKVQPWFDRAISKITAAGR